MAWMDPEWPERERQYRDKLIAASRSNAPDTPPNRAAARVVLLVGAVIWVAILVAAGLYLLHR